MEGHDTRTVNFNRIRTLGIRELGSIEMLSLLQLWSGGIRDLRNPVRDAFNEADLRERGYPLTDLARVKRSLENYPTLKFYLFSSELDYLAPPVLLQRAARRIGERVIYEELPGVGHEAYRNREVVSKLLPPQEPAR